MNSKAVCSGHRVSIPSPSRAWLPLSHRHGPCSPSPSSDMQAPSTADVLLRGRLRADSIRRHLNGSAAAAADLERGGDVTVPTTLGTSLGSDEYMVTVGLGTPAVTQTVIMDTGSDVSWVQCRPCPVPAPCHLQKDSVFNPTASATYSAFPCSSSACRRLGRAVFNGCSGLSAPLCQYVVNYADGSNSNGTYSSDKLMLTAAYAVDGFRFGCSHADPQFSSIRAAGLIALGGGALSLVAQTGEKAFSYCLPPTASHSGFLRLGVPHVSSSRFVVTPMHSIGGIKTYYGVLLQGIVVNGRRLDIPPSVFGAGSVVDSGTVVTQLPLTAHRALQVAFRKEMMRMGMHPPVAPKNGFDTCYNLTTGGDLKSSLPSVALVFDRGATVELDPSGIIFDGCLAFDSTGDDVSVGIIGNVQQKTFEVLYDIAGQAMGFRHGAC
ncbi:unnamed protein product [Urochloa humidicola]